MGNAENVKGEEIVTSKSVSLIIDLEEPSIELDIRQESRKVKVDLDSVDIRDFARNVGSENISNLTVEIE